VFKIAIISGSFFALLSVVMGAFGAHLLKDTLTEYSKAIYDKAVLYQIFHSIGILIISTIDYNLSEINLSISIWFFIFGILFFSGSLYLLALTDIKVLGAVTPIGGLLFILGWVLVIVKVVMVLP
tara:strand:+ start:1228 stop:1602 length:375 start_codon:yes stop_codon:yes gene_type:complete